MKKLFAFFMALALACATSGCSDDYDDSAIWDEIEQIRSELAAINSQLKTLQSALDNGCVVTDVQPLENGSGYVLVFSDNSRITIENGKAGEPGAAGSAIGVRENGEGVLCWTVDGEFMLDPTTGKSVPVTGAKGEQGAPGAPGESGHTPALAIDDEGYWTVDGVRIVSNGKEVKAQGDSIFSDVRDGEQSVTLVLSDGSELTVQKAVASSLAFDSARLIYEAGKSYTVSYTAKNIEFVELLSAPDGWDVEIDEKNSSIAISAAAADAGSRIVIAGAGKSEGGRTYMAALSLKAKLPAGGFYVYNEGWFGHDPAVLNYCCDGVWYTRVYQDMNPGSPLGATGTNIVRNAPNGLTYLVCKEAPILVETNADLEMQSKIDDKSTTGQGWDFSPYDAETGYMTAAKGLFKVNLDPVGLAESVHTSGKSYADVRVEAGKVFFICDGKALVYDPADAATTEICSANTGFAKSSDGRLWVASKTEITSISPGTLTVKTYSTGDSKVYYNTMAYTPCAIALSPDGGTVYFGTGSGWSIKDIAKLDVASGTVSVIWTSTENYALYGSNVAVDPKTGDLYILTCKSYSLCRIYVLNPDGSQKQVIPYTAENDYSYWFPSEIVFD